MKQQTNELMTRKKRDKRSTENVAESRIETHQIHGQAYGCKSHSAKHPADI